jgi:hypothetical protein
VNSTLTAMLSVGNTEHVHLCVTKKIASSLTCVLQLQCIFSMATPPEQVSTV